MRKLWPPYYDDFTLRVWAAVTSVVVSSVLWALAFSKPDSVMYCLMVPGAFAEMIVARRGVEEGITLPGLIAWMVTNAAFYYFIAWWLIRAFQPVKVWWPTKRS
jgi:apolipoprotein N-acyltransferase